jgi:hypothetical protein
MIMQQPKDIYLKAIDILNQVSEDIVVKYYKDMEKSHGIYLYIYFNMREISVGLSLEQAEDIACTPYSYGLKIAQDFIETIKKI